MDKVNVFRKQHLAEKIVIVDGLPGCGKTMLSPIVAALDRVELLTYAYEIEHICALNYLGRIEFDAAVTMVRMLTDLQLYNTMIARETNFRLSDLSSAFRSQPWRYIKRLFQKDDEAIIKKIEKEKPILNLTTHNLLGISEPLFHSLGRRIIFIEICRHPLYMIRQQILNMKRLISNVRHFTVYFKYKDTELPFWVFGWEELFINSNPTEKAIYSIKYISELIERKIKDLAHKYDAQIITIPFEKFVIDPWPYMKQIEVALDTRITSFTRKEMKKQRVPRKMYAEGIGLKIYKRYGWELPKTSSEKEELELRRQSAAPHASSEAMNVLNQLSADYEKEFLPDIRK